MMLLRKRQKHRPDSSNSASSSHKLFVGYPYPIINQLTEQQKRELEKESKHRFSRLSSFEWHRENFRKTFGLLHHLHGHQSPSSIFEDSFRQAHLNDRSSKSIFKKLKNLTTPTRIQRSLTTSANPSVDDKNQEIKQRRTRR